MDAHIDIYGCGRRDEHAEPGCLEPLDLVEIPQECPLKSTLVSSQFNRKIRPGLHPTLVLRLQK
jgi:hypothetical protein